MQPSTQQRPVMDISAPQRPAAPAAHTPPADQPVHEAPPLDKDTPKHSQSPSPIPDTTPSVSEHHEQAPETAHMPHNPRSTPAGAVTVAVIAMCILAGLAITIYLQSN